MGLHDDCVTHVGHELTTPLTDHPLRTDLVASVARHVVAMVQPQRGRLVARVLRVAVLDDVRVALRRRDMTAVPDRVNRMVKGSRRGWRRDSQRPRLQRGARGVRVVRRRSLRPHTEGGAVGGSRVRGTRGACAWCARVVRVICVICVVRVSTHPGMWWVSFVVPSKRSSVVDAMPVLAMNGRSDGSSPSLPRSFW